MTDRRIAKTRTALLAALTSLMQEQDWDSIQIATICAKADVSRSTFYTHFDTKNDLLVYGFSRLEAELAGEPPGRGLDHDRTFAFVPALLNHIEGHSALFARMRDSITRAGIFSRFRAVLEARCRAEIAASRKWRTIDADGAAFLQGGIFGMIESWHGARRRISATVMTRRIDALTIKVLGALRQS